MKKQYRVTCKGMFVDGTLRKTDETFWLDPDKAQDMRAKRKHLTFEAVDGEDKRASSLGREQDGGAGNARLEPNPEPSEGPKKRGRGRPRKREQVSGASSHEAGA